MSANFNLDASQIRAIGLTPPDTNDHVMFTAGKERPALIGVYAVNLTAGGITWSLAWTDGTTEYPIHTFSALAANAEHMDPDIFIPLEEDGEIIVSCTGGNSVTITIVVAQRGTSFKS